MDDQQPPPRHRPPLRAATQPLGRRDRPGWPGFEPGWTFPRLAAFFIAVAVLVDHGRRPGRRLAGAVGYYRYPRCVWPLLTILAVLVCGFVALGAALG